jgi:putative DNA primase/helicase
MENTMSETSIDKEASNCNKQEDCNKQFSGLITNVKYGENTTPNYDIVKNTTNNNNELDTSNTDDQRQHKLEHVQKAVNKCIDEYNKIYFKAVISGKNYVVRIITGDKEQGKQIEFFTHYDFKQMLIAESNCCYGLNKDSQYLYKPKANVWLTNKKSNFAPHGVIFDPARQPLATSGGRLNLWQGFALEQSELDIEAIRNDEQIKLYLQHITDIICDGNNDYAKTIIQYLAHIFQRPDEKPQYAIILKSGMGTGKGLFLHCLRSIIGDDHSTLTKNLNSNFNAYLGYKILLIADDVNVCSKEATAMMKGYITEPQVSIEAKRKDQIMVDSYTRFIFTTNEEAVVRVDTDERRYFILRVSEKQKQNKKYFDKLHFLRKRDPQHTYFCRKLLTYLQNVDISDLDISNAPKTIELAEEKINCLPNEEAFVYDMLESGVNTTGYSAMPTFNVRVRIDEIQENYLEFIKKSNRKASFGCYKRKLGKVFSKIEVVRTNNEPRDYVFKSLDESRQLFTEAYSVPFTPL